MRLGLSSYLLMASGLFAASAGYSHFHSREIEQKAATLERRSLEASDAYSSTLAAGHQEDEMKLLDERRATLLRASAWRRVGLLSIALTVVSLFAAWVARELHRFREIALESPQEATAARAKGGG